jgi:HEAT repeat protein
LKEKDWIPESDEDQIVFAIALEDWRALAKRGSDAVPFLVKLLEDPSPFVREEAARTLAMVPDPRAVPALIRCIEDGDAWVELDGSIRFTDNDKRWHEKALKSCILRADAGTAHAKIRSACTRALVSIGAPAIESLVSAAKSRMAHVRESAFSALTRIGRPTTRALVSLLGHSEADVKSRAYKALKRITGEDFGHDCVKWTEWLKQHGGESVERLPANATGDEPNVDTE